MQTRFLFGDEADAVAFWSNREWKKWAVDVIAGPAKRPTYRATHYAHARTAEAAVASVKRGLVMQPPRGARFSARLAGPRELGCVPTPSLERRPS